MKRLVAFIAAVGLLASGVTALAQGGPRWKGSGGWGPSGPFAKLYDPKTVETITGRIVGVSHAVPVRGVSTGLHLSVKTDQETVSVHLGPTWYLENQDVKLAPGDVVEVTGSRVTLGGKPAIIAAEVKKGDEVLKLRDEAGVPVWSGWRRG